ncbi:TetR family transcriptional regulator [Catellatospora sp. TT07R-123]|uniref:TetR/AcrR family transcriptional regulator n=1 Tax=Catellatospora sp. TT07R-123 TaxID=2733863 RepID=UPI001B27F109|nr:TetR/AcrR family transcriptional regulator [Catellatospora sp. TT07R-123]GHJ44027.1 TetR family transcriptional regulator [Catellatospora sp. TT07R-123]
MTVYGGQGDPARTMALLWRADAPAAARTAPGPRPGLTVDAIVAAGIALADESGLAGLSMRAVGQRLGTSAMALYTYVPSKRELLDLMYDQAHAGLPTGYAAAGLREAVLAWAADLWDRCLAHPWLLQVSYARPVLGPHEQAVLEALLGVLDRATLGAAARRTAVSALLHLVRGLAQTAAEAREAARATGDSDEQWWQARAGQIAHVAPDFAARFPHSAALAQTGAQTGDQAGEQAAYDPVEQARQALTGALNLLLDGLGAQS